MVLSNVHFPILVQNYNFPCAFATECLCNSIFTATFCSFLQKKQKDSHIKVPAFPPPHWTLRIIQTLRTLRNFRNIRPLRNIRTLRTPPEHPPSTKKNPRAFSARGIQIISP